VFLRPPVMFPGQADRAAVAVDSMQEAGGEMGLSWAVNCQLIPQATWAVVVVVVVV
jgi:hypothetical protein